MLLTAFTIFATLATHQNDSYEIERKVILRIAEIAHVNITQSGKIEDIEAQRAKLETQGDLHISHEEYDEAASAYEKAIQKAKQDPILYMKLARAHIFAGRIQQGITYMEEVVRKNPKHANSHAYLAREFHKADQFDKAESHATAALNLDPVNSLALSVRAASRIFGKGGAKKLTFTSRTDTAATDIKNLSRLDCTAILDDLNRLIPLTGGESILTPYYQFVLRAGIRLKLEETEKAVGDLLHATTIEPKNAEAWLRLAEVLADRGSIQHCEVIIQILQDSKITGYKHVNLVARVAHLCLLNDLWEKAEQLSKIGLTLDEDNLELKLIRARCSFLRGDYELAHLQFASLPNLDSLDVSIDDLSWISLSLSTCPVPKYQDKARGFALALRGFETKKSSELFAYLALASAHANLGRHVEAMKVVDQFKSVLSAVESALPPNLRRMFDSACEQIRQGRAIRWNASAKRFDGVVPE